jgi:hypothetical protein
MAHFAEINNGNAVIRVLVVPDEEEDRGQEFLADDLHLGGTWVQTSYNTRAGAHKSGGTPLRGNYAGIGYIYDADLDAFYESQPFPSWVLNETTFQWEAPVAHPGTTETLTHPDTGNPVEVPLNFNWDEATTSWVEVAGAG